MAVNGGFIFLHRKLRQSPHFRSSAERGLFVDLLLEAAYEDGVVDWHGVEVPIKRGQVIASLEEIASWTTSKAVTDAQISVVRRILDRWESEHVISRSWPGKSDSPPKTVLGTPPKPITINKFNEYQASQRIPRQGGVSRKRQAHKESKEEEKKESSLSLRSRESSFARFWEIYPRKVGKIKAEESWRRAVAAGADPEKMILALGYWLESDEGRRARRDGYVPHPATWLNHGRYMDEAAQPPARRAARPAEPLRSGSGKPIV